jgi:hypothetical protein
MFPAGFEPAIPKIERRQIYALDRTATGIVVNLSICSNVGRILNDIFYVNRYLIDAVYGFTGLPILREYNADVKITVNVFAS